MAADVFGEFEEGEDFEEEEESNHDEEEGVEETAEEIEVNDGGKTGVRGRTGFAIFGAQGRGTKFGAEDAAAEAPESAEARDESGQGGFAAVAFHAGEKSESDKDEDEVGGPHADGGGDDDPGVRSLRR